MNNPLMLIFISPFYIVPLGIGVLILVGLWSLMRAIIHRIRGPEVIYTPKKDSPELIEAIRTGYSQRLGLELNEIFPDPITGADIDRLLAVREKLFPREFSEFFYSGFPQDLSPNEFKALALRLYLEMAFTRSYLLEKSARLWSQKNESLWVFHAPKPLRKLAPDYYRQLLTEFKKSGHSENGLPVAV
ncbi:MAG: hypothetical protein KDD45_00535 [Bdellovibrionales bacterium]|nr:hypothetical protein [Bdellovibrionales bacterium]